MDEDYYGYREKCNNAHREWIANNPDKVDAYQRKRRTDPESKVKAIMNNADSRGIPFDFAAKFDMLVLQPCFYCGSESSDRSLRGLDRVDNTLGYTFDNVVPACTCCNHMRGVKQVDEFVADIRRISAHMQLDDSCINDDLEASIVYGKPVEDQDELSISPDLSDYMQLCIKCSPCVYCGINFSCGMDRMYNDIVPSCAACKFMRCHLTLDQFKSHVSCIARHTKYWVLQDTVDIMTTMCKIQAQPVSFECEKGVLVFPSRSAAENMGVRSGLRKVSCRERRNNRVSSKDAIDICSSYF
jgi:hypothetical protein